MSTASEPPHKKRKLDMAASTIASTIPTDSNNATTVPAADTNANGIPSTTRTNDESKSNDFKPRQWKDKSGRFVSKFETFSPLFEKYYKKQQIITDPKEWELFIKTLRTELPTSFRFNPAHKLHKLHKERLLTDFYNLQKAEDDGLVHDEMTFSGLHPMPFYPHSMGWQCNFPKRFIKKHPEYFKSFRKFLIDANDCGIISRQETVSMIPALFLAQFIQPHSKVIDMCAAPGNKTSQILELLDYELTGKWRDGEHSGFVIANDADAKRAHVMVHQLKRVGINRFCATNKLAQCIPRMKDPDANTIYFDAILCDVPCSSDGTLRKTPDLWAKWKIAFGNGLHAVQLSILIHAAHLCAVGGTVVYSTCTFNPIENEAVISSALLFLNGFHQNEQRRYHFELVDMKEVLPELKRNEGLKEWVVWDKQMKDDLFYTKYSDIEPKKRKQFKESMFAPQYREQCASIKDSVHDLLHLERCMRFLPHYHDTGGFFVAVIRKTENPEYHQNKKRVFGTNEPIESKEDITMKEPKTESESKSEPIKCTESGDGMLSNKRLAEIEAKERDRRNLYDDNVPYHPMSEMKDYDVEIAKLISFYGLRVKGNGTENEPENASDSKENENGNGNDKIPILDVDELLIRGKTNPRALWFVPKSIGEIIGSPENHQLRIVQSGCRAFCRHDTKVTEHACKWRLTQDGCEFLVPYLTKQVVRVPLELYLRFCFAPKLGFKFEEIEALEDGKWKSLVEENMKSQTGGPVVVMLREEDAVETMNPLYRALSGWKSFTRIDLMVKKSAMLLLYSHLKEVFAEECAALAEKDESLQIDMKSDDRKEWNVIKNAETNKNMKFKQIKKKKWKRHNRDWQHRKWQDDTKGKPANGASGPKSG